MKRDEDGYLSACFISKNENRVEVQFGFELVNGAKNDHSKRTGKRGGFQTVFEVDVFDRNPLRVLVHRRLLRSQTSSVH